MYCFRLMNCNRCVVQHGLTSITLMVRYPVIAGMAAGLTCLCFPVLIGVAGVTQPGFHHRIPRRAFLLPCAIRGIFLVIRR